MKHLTRFLLCLSLLGYVIIIHAQEVVKDYDGNVYKTVKIGTQVWMAENLKVTHYRNGVQIPKVIFTNTDWEALTYGAYCTYNGTRYGLHYNWYAVIRGTLAPEGWHVPSDAEWTTLTNYLGGIDVAGGKLKETGTTHWAKPNTGATNSSGFTALPRGARDRDGSFTIVGFGGYWWSSTEEGASTAWSRYVDYGTNSVYRNYLDKVDGLSLRCIKD